MLMGTRKAHGTDGESCVKSGFTIVEECSFISLKICLNRKSHTMTELLGERQLTSVEQFCSASQEMSLFKASHFLLLFFICSE